MTLASSQLLDLLPLDKLSTLGPVTYSLVEWNQAVDEVPADPLNRDYVWHGCTQWSWQLLGRLPTPAVCSQSVASIQSAGLWELTGLLLLISYRQRTVMLWNATKFNGWLSLIVPIFWVLHSYIGICCCLCCLYGLSSPHLGTWLFIHVLTFLQTC